MYLIVHGKYLYICIYKYGLLAVLTLVSPPAGVMTEPTMAGNPQDQLTTSYISRVKKRGS